MRELPYPRMESPPLDRRVFLPAEISPARLGAISANHHPFVDNEQIQAGSSNAQMP